MTITETAWKCDLGCNGYFGSLGGLNGHKGAAESAGACPRRKITKTGRPAPADKWPCVHCLQMFTEGVLANHIKAREAKGVCSGQPVPPPTKAELTCKECSKVFTTRSGFKTHLRGSRVHMDTDEAKAALHRTQREAYGLRKEEHAIARAAKLEAMDYDEREALRKVIREYDATKGTEYKKLRNAEKRQWVSEYKTEHGCADCGIKGLPGECYDLDHLPQYEKKGNVSVMVRMSWGTLLDEIDKCEVVCAICHRIRTMERRILAARA